MFCIKTVGKNTFEICVGIQITKVIVTSLWINIDAKVAVIGIR
jgi:hypothetical protein